MTSTEAPLKRRHPMIAFAGGVIAPGLGLWLTGRLPAALLTAALAIAAVLVVPLLVVDGVVGSVERLPSLLLAVSAAIRFSAAVIAAWFAFRDPPRAFKPYEHAWWAVGFVLLSFVASTSLRDRVAFDRVASFAFGCKVGDSGVTACPGEEGAPSLREDRPVTMAVIVKRGFVPANVDVNDVVAIRADTTSWKGRLPGIARVIAKAGSTVRVDENGRITVDGFPVVGDPCVATVPHFGLPCTAEKQATPTGAKERVVVRTSFPREFPTTSVGPGQVFVLPDDRGRQLQAPAGLVNLADLEGRVVAAR
jgi:hypothetical protein